MALTMAVADQLGLLVNPPPVSQPLLYACVRDVFLVLTNGELNAFADSCMALTMLAGQLGPLVDPPPASQPTYARSAIVAAARRYELPSAINLACTLAQPP